MRSKEKIVEDILKQLKPDRDALLKLISSQITEEMLVDIVNGDYGDKEKAQNLTALKSIIVNTIFPTVTEIDYEVLWLCRDMEPDLYSTLDMNALYLKRAFGCTVLLICDLLPNADYRYVYLTNLDYNLIQLIESVNYLGKDFQLAMISFLVWKLSANIDGLDIFFDDGGGIKDVISIFTLLYFLLKTSYYITENNLKILTECLIDRSKQAEIEYNKRTIYNNYNKEFLGTFDSNYEGKQYIKWIQIAKEIPSLTTHLKDQELVNQLKNISELISKNEHLYKKD